MSINLSKSFSAGKLPVLAIVMIEFVRLFVLFGLLSASACSLDVSRQEDNPKKAEDAVPAEPTWSCVLAPGQEADSIAQLGCLEDFQTLASTPADASIPGARSLKTIVDRLDANRLYFQNSKRYPIHWEFAHQNLSGNGHPVVPSLAEFNQIEYYSPDRRFILGSLSYYEGPNRWVFELSPYDTADAEMIATAFEALSKNSYIGPSLAFHPTSAALEGVAKSLPGTIPVISTDELFAGIDYQPLNLGASIGRLRILKADALENTYLGFRDIVVLDAVPNDISVVQGIITSTFQTPLSHINVLSQNRKTPNMGLKGAHTRPEIKSLDGQWVKLEVQGFEWSLRKATQEEADQWWEQNKPKPLGVPALDLETRDLRNCKEMIQPKEPMLEQIKGLIPAFGGKASHYGALANLESVPSPRAFAIPVRYYREFMEQNGFSERVKALLADPSFKNDPAVRDRELKALRDAMKAVPIDPDFLAMLTQKLEQDYPGIRMRFRSSTNAEDLDGFTGAGLYTSKSGQLGSVTHPVQDAIRKVWASVWFFRAFEERSYRSIDHLGVGMAILVHRSFPDEEANGVALTANPFDTNGAEPGFYINVQAGEESVVQPKPGVRSDQYIHHWTFPGQPLVFLGRSSLVPKGQSVLSSSQSNELGKALHEIHQHFQKAYGPTAEDPKRWYAMDVEFKFDQPTQGGEIQLWVKQARPHPGRGK